MLKELPVEKRKDFSEVLQAPTAEEAVAYASAALDSCKGGCEASCPLDVDIHGVLDHLRRREFQQARDLLDRENPLPSMCARFCPGSCAGSCSCAKEFRAVERYLGDHYKASPSKAKPCKVKVAVVGAGVAGLTVASMLRKNGLSVKLIEATDRPGGILARFTPEFRLPGKVIQQEIGGLVTNMDLSLHAVGGAMHPLEHLAHKFDAVVMATGANKPAFLGIPGEHFSNVFTAADYLALPKKKSQDRTVIIGGSDMAIDAARVCKRLGDSVTLLFHKDYDYLPASESSVHHAKQEGVMFMMLTKPTRIMGNGQANSIECVHMMLAESEIDDTRVAVPIENSEFEIQCDKIIVAVGLEPNPTIGRYTPLRTVGKGRLWTNGHMQTNVPNVFAAGEIAIGSNSIDRTIAHAKGCAKNVISYLSGEIEEEEL